MVEVGIIYNQAESMELAGLCYHFRCVSCILKAIVAGDQSGSTVERANRAFSKRIMHNLDK